MRGLYITPGTAPRNFLPSVRYVEWYLNIASGNFIAVSSLENKKMLEKKIETHSQFSKHHCPDQQWPREADLSLASITRLECLPVTQCLTAQSHVPGECAPPLITYVEDLNLYSSNIKFSIFFTQEKAVYDNPFLPEYLTLEKSHPSYSHLSNYLSPIAIKNPPKRPWEMFALLLLIFKKLADIK